MLERIIFISQPIILVLQRVLAGDDGYALDLAHSIMRPLVLLVEFSKRLDQRSNDTGLLKVTTVVHGRQHLIRALVRHLMLNLHIGSISVLIPLED